MNIFCYLNEIHKIELLAVSGWPKSEGIHEENVSVKTKTENKESSLNSGCRKNKVYKRVRGYIGGNLFVYLKNI